ncbi:endo alpha-1,4 polygalactosaminidase [Kitasatospora sp. NPDC006697]|uniref:endo alpha-1,4 polygalactosaminidase n=1 Tax=Kitasatospora sp. NPDC006697 TaxID=3364020 RepID=UPI00369A6420
MTFPGARTRSSLTRAAAAPRPRSARALLGRAAAATALLLLTACSSTAAPAPEGAPAPSGAGAAAPSAGSPASASPAPESPAPASPSAAASAAPAKSSAPPASSAAPATPAAPAAPVPAGTVWHPSPGTPWQWQLTTPVDRSVDVPVYDIDGFENDASVVAALHAEGRKVICYVNAGAWEDFRPDASSYPTALRGSTDGWNGERWLDIRQLSALRPLLAARFDLCRGKGFDAVEPDLLEGYANSTGFPLTAADQLAFNRMVADLAHQRGLAVALKNDLGQIPDLVGDFDFAIDEQCAEFKECDSLTPFVKAGKAVLHVEYNVAPADFCSQTTRLGFSSMAKHLKLDAWRQAC